MSHHFNLLHGRALRALITAAESSNMPRDIQTLIRENCVVAGGSTFDCLFGSKQPKDWDLYFTNDRALNIVKSWVSTRPRSVEIMPSYPGHPGYDEGDKHQIACADIGNIQLILFTKADTIIEFDVIHAIPSYHLKDGTVYHPLTLWRWLSMKNRVLVHNSRSSDEMKLSGHIGRLANRGWYAPIEHFTLRYDPVTKDYEQPPIISYAIPDGVKVPSQQMHQLSTMISIIDTHKLESNPMTPGKCDQYELFSRMLTALESNDYADLKQVESDYILSKLLGDKL